MKALVPFLALFLCGRAHATLPPDVSLQQVLARTDHVLIGHLIKIDMVNDKGVEIVYPASRTGPGRDKTIRFHVAVDEICITNAKTVPPILIVPLDRLMSNSLEGVLDAEGDKIGQRFILLLRGPQFVPPFRGTFSASLKIKEEILKLLGRK